ncbi:hypothetical protein EDD21DRAFT_413377 [Dissophora ornata]|nr:hypothetical protein EDD21DRAFT_413377 [Dissophora ornata]
MGTRGQEGLADFLEREKWTVVISETESDLQIARECQDRDIVITGDSDALVYSTVAVIWRPLSSGRFLEYCMKDVLSTLTLYRTQFTVFVIASRNDYNPNVYGLDCETNYGITKRMTCKGVGALRLERAQMVSWPFYAGQYRALLHTLIKHALYTKSEAKVLEGSSRRGYNVELLA